MKQYKNMIISRKDAITLINALSEKLMEEDNIVVLKNIPIFFVLFDNKQ